MNVFDSLLNNDFVVYRRERTADGQGGWEVALVETEQVRGRIRPANSAERTVALQEQRQLTHVLYVRAGEEIGRGDQVVCGELSVEVLGVREPSQAGHHLEIDCREIQKEE